MLTAFLKLFCLPCSDNIDYDAFHDAVVEGNLAVIQTWINAGADIEVGTNDDHGFTPLALAVIQGNGEVIDFLLRNNADIHTRDKRNNTLLAVAAYSNHVGLVGFFLEQGISIECQGLRGNTPLMVASWKGNIGVVELLVAQQANANATNEFGDTPLILAARANRLGVVEYLLANGAILETKGQNGNTALLAASQEGNTEIVKCLFRHGADLEATNDDDDTALSLAIKHNHVESSVFLQEPNRVTLQSRYDNMRLAGEPPAHLTDPISMNLMDDPITLSSGHTYERGSIKGWALISKPLTCPISRQPFKSEELDFGTNTLIKDLCEQFVESSQLIDTNIPLDQGKESSGYIDDPAIYCLDDPTIITLQKRLDNIGYMGGVPPHLMCPLSRRLMDNPVTLSTGKTYDRSSIIIWAMMHQPLICPITQQIFKQEDLDFAATIELKNLCEKFVENLEEQVKSAPSTSDVDSPARNGNGSHSPFQAINDGNDSEDEIGSEATSLLAFG